MKTKDELFKTAVTKSHIFTHNGEFDIPADTVVGVKYFCHAMNRMINKVVPVYTVTLQNGRVWGDMYGNNLKNFVL